MTMRLLLATVRHPPGLAQSSLRCVSAARTPRSLALLAGSTSVGEHATLLTQQQQQQQQLQRRSFHDTTPASSSQSSRRQTNNAGAARAAADDSDEERAQPFAENTLHAGEWDPLHYENPMYRPKYQPRTKMLSKEDFENRPSIMFHSTFVSMADAQASLSWITHDQQGLIYQAYKEMLRVGYDKYKVTSHEYVIKCLAQKFQMVPNRVAAIVQLQSNEEDYRAQGIELCDGAAAYMDSMALQEIAACYKAHNVKQPHDVMFVEEPAWRGQSGRSKKLKEIDDLLDVDQIWKDFEEKHLPVKARKMLTKHRFIEDVDDTSVEMPADKETKGYIRQREQFVQEQKEHVASLPATDHVKMIREREAKGRRRFNWVAQLANTRELKKARRAQDQKPNNTWGKVNKQKLPTSYSNESLHNTVVLEKDGKLRPATLHDVKNVAWKPRRHKWGTTDSVEETTQIIEFTYRQAKLKWLDQINGRKPKLAWKNGAKKPVEEEAKEEKEEDEELTFDEDEEEEEATTEETSEEGAEDSSATEEEGTDKKD
eukprot:CAMPEP_0172454774 /NCGR_PEP_ID=MMETSP1065-20121228/11663_1 /TAXON_ID=265537 /ORGANISM="Amphiprora paludosa, Strain CCMP125" /LENGTH=540 /DNA_ID=CAMNT_0013207161 /DNA_START=1 /DNA_END=1623 /DNA_ORIENTATION=-